MAVLATLQHDRRATARLEEALASRHRLLPCAGWRGLWDEVARGAADGCVVDVYHPFRPASLRQLQRLRRSSPALAVMVYSDFARREMDLFHLGRLGVDGVIFAGSTDDPRGIVETVERALARSLARRVVAALEGRISDLGLDCLRWAVEHARQGPSVGDLAGAVGHGSRTLARDLRAQGLPPAHRILLWGRLLQAGRLLEDGCTVEAAAYEVGYSTAGALRRALKRNAGCPPSVVAARGGAACVLEGFLRGRSRKARPRRWSTAGARSPLAGPRR